MWDISKSVIQLEVSSKIAKYYSTFPGLNAKKLLYEIDELRNTFAKMDVVLPSINISIADSLPPDSYILHIGVYHFMRDFKTDKIIEILHAFVSQYTYDNYCKESVTELFNKGVSQLHANNFQEAYSSFANTYYCSSIYKENYDVMVNSILNLCGIEFINQNFDDFPNRHDHTFGQFLVWYIRIMGYAPKIIFRILVISCYFFCYTPSICKL